MYPLAGAPTQGQGSVSPPVSTPPVFAATSSNLVPGDRVRVELELEIVRMMQEGHGGWNDQMKEVRITITVITRSYTYCATKAVRHMLAMNYHRNVAVVF